MRTGQSRPTSFPMTLATNPLRVVGSSKRARMQVRTAPSTPELAALAAQELGRPDPGQRLEAAWRAAPTMSRFLRRLAVDDDGYERIRSKPRGPWRVVPRRPRGRSDCYGCSSATSPEPPRCWRNRPVWVGPIPIIPAHVTLLPPTHRRWQRPHVSRTLCLWAAFAINGEPDQRLIPVTNVVRSALPGRLQNERCWPASRAPARGESCVGQRAA